VEAIGEETFAAKIQKMLQEDSYGFRPQRNQHGAIRHIRRVVKEGVHGVVDIDIRAYFDNISHEKLKRLVEQHISDRQVRYGRRSLRIQERWCDSLTYTHVQLILIDLRGRSRNKKVNYNRNNKVEDN